MAEELESFLHEFDNPFDWGGRAVPAHYVSQLRVGHVVRLLFKWGEDSWNKHYARILSIERDQNRALFQGEIIEVYPQWSMHDGYRVPLGAHIRFGERHVYELPGFRYGEIHDWPEEENFSDKENVSESEEEEEPDFLPLYY